MKKKVENTFIHKVYLTLETMKSATIKEIAEVCKLTVLQATPAVDRLLELKKVHVSGWDHTETARCPVRIIRIGRGENAPRSKKSDIIARDIIQYDIKLKMAEHKKWMKTFVPHPDYASAWLFNQPRVELLGARYE
jgi:hypothetical protein